MIAIGRNVRNGSMLLKKSEGGFGGKYWNQIGAPYVSMMRAAAV